MKQALALLALLTCACLTRAQINYVRNPDFEQHSYCPSQFDQIDAANFWNAMDSVTPAISSYCRPDYFNACSTNFGVPSAGHFYQQPRSGNGLAMVQVFYDEHMPGQIPFQRDYLQGRLYRKLIAGKSYCVTFYASLADGSQYAVNHIGAYLDNGSMDTVNTCGLPMPYITPQVYTSEVIKDTAHWTKIEGSFIANGTERFITIGNFFSKANTSYDSLTYNIPVLGNSSFAWHLVDDVSVIESDLPADAGPDRHITLGDSTFIGRSPEIGLECTWYVAGNSTPIGFGAGLWVKPTTTTTYIVEQILCGMTRRDTVKVEVWRLDVPGVQGYSQQAYHLSPNPLTGNMIYLHQAITDEKPVHVSIINAAGQVVHEDHLRFSNHTATLQAIDLPTGLYLLRVNDENVKTYLIRFIAEHP